MQENNETEPGPRDTITSDPQPALAEGKQTLTSQTRSNPANQASSSSTMVEAGTVSGHSDSPAKTKLTFGQPKKRFKKPILIIATILFALLIIISALFFVGKIIPNKFSETTYDNNQGGVFMVNFYTDHVVEPVSKNLPDSTESDESSKLMQLVSRVSVDGRAPITMWAVIAKDKVNSSMTKFMNNDCSYDSGGEIKVFDVYINYINSNVAVCALRDQNLGQDIMYFSSFHNGEEGFAVYFNQDIDFSHDSSNTTEANEILEKAGLEVYQEDIKTILSSIKPAN